MHLDEVNKLVEVSGKETDENFQLLDALFGSRRSWYEFYVRET